ncbi:MAG TPA: nucleotide-binding protein [Fluviicola sp.]|nr:nucleotide-binding protein [Fluviicola sp.]
MAKYKGQLSELQDALENYGFTGTWQTLTNGNKFTAHDGGHLTFFTNGTLLVQGSEAAQQRLNDFVEILNGTPEKRPVTAINGVNGKQEEPQVFVVYGHDNHSREQLEHILLKVGIKPFVLGNTTGGGLTIIEALEKQVGVCGSAKAGIVLLTPDDMGYSKKAGAQTIRPRARQNVVLEMGMLLSKFGRTHTTILIKGELEHPSDIHGIIYLSYKDHVKEIAVRLFKRLEECGFQIDPKKAMEALN